MAALSYQPPISVEEYLELDRNSQNARYEYIDGHVTMLAGGSLNHSTIAVNITSILKAHLRGGSCRVFNSDARVRLSESRIVLPDASVTCDARDRGEGDIVEYPVLVVEVLSPSTEAYDRGLKFAYYRDCPTIQEYLLIDSQRQAIEVYRRERRDLWVLRTISPETDVELASLGVRFSFDAVYEDVDFP